EGSGAEVAHLKMTLAPSSGPGDLALINLVDRDLVPELSERLQAPVRDGQLVVNLRAEAESELLAATLTDEIAQRSELRLEHVEHFAPGQPEPTHRLCTA
ncbi:MAG: cobalamin biosynthesis protein P47K, partial [Acidobacteriota bacterium]